MKDKLKDFIEANRDQFDVYEPDPSVWSKINPHKITNRFRRHHWFTIASRAAILVFVFFSAFLLSELMHDNKVANANLQNANNQQTRLTEAEAYYSNVFNDRLNQIQQFTSTDPEIERQVNYDLSELDSIYTELKKDLKDNVANEEVVEALIQNYKLKIQVLEDMLSKFKSFKQEKQKDSEHEI